MLTAVESVLSKQGKIHEWIGRWGGSTSEAVLESSCQTFTIEGVNGFIGFRQEGNAVVVFGDPICDPKDATKLTQAFYEHCKENKLEIIFLIVTEEFANKEIKKNCRVMIEVCEELVFDPQIDPTIGHKAHRLRNKINHAQGLHLTFNEYKQNDPKIEAEMQSVCKKWLQSRTGPQIHLGPLQLFADREEKRWFYVKDAEGKMVSAALIRKLDRFHGWFIKFLVTTPDAPRGASELMMLNILEILRNEGCSYLSVGMVPATELGEIHGLGKFFKTLARNLFSLAKWIFGLEHRKTYWLQFHPTSHRSFILFTKPNVGIKDLRAIMKALNVNV